MPKTRMLLLTLVCLALPALATTQTAQTAQAEATTTVVYDTVTQPQQYGLTTLKIGSSARLEKSTTQVTLAAQVASATPFTASDAVIAVRPVDGSTNLDVGYQSNVAINATTRTISGTRTFPVGTYQYWFAYQRGGVWQKTAERRFTINDTNWTDPSVVAQDPVDSSERSPGVLTSIGADSRSQYAGMPVRFAAHLDGTSGITMNPVIFAVRDSAGNGYDAWPAQQPPAGASMDVTALRGFPVGTYTYWLAYSSGGTWHNLGDPRSFKVVAPPAVTEPTGPAWVQQATLSDEFTSFSTSKWTKTPAYEVSCKGTVPMIALKAANSTVTSGELRLITKSESTDLGWEPCGGTSKTSSYSGGMVQSKFAIPAQPSFVEVRARMNPTAANVLSAIWLQTFPTSIANNPNPEIDIQESFSPTGMTSTLHTWTCDSTSCARPHVHLGSFLYGGTGADLGAAMHTYGLERKGGWLNFYLDHQVAWQWKVRPGEESLVNMARKLVFSDEAHLGTPATLPATFRIDYVRTYKYQP